MTTAELDLDLRIRTFKASSSFTPGDACSFSIDFGDEITLPGRHDPVAYMEQLGIDVTGKNVLVVCPGNAGLAVAALRAGASTVVVLEPRNVYHRSLPEVSNFASEVIGATFSQRTDSSKLIEAFDIVIWSEGLDDIQHPKTLVEQVVASMAKGSMLYWEINHGQSGVLPESTNAWKPTATGFTETLERLGDLKVVSELEGRAQTRTIYTIQNNNVRAEKVAEKIEELDQKATVAIETAINSPSTGEKAGALDVAIEAVIAKTEELQAADLLPTPVANENVFARAEKAAKVAEASEPKKAPSTSDQSVAARVTSLMTGHEEGELDSVYEGRASTPKSKAKKKTKAKSRKRAKKTKPKS